MVSFRKLRTTRISGFCGVVLAFGLCGLDHLSAQGPGSGPPSEDSSSDDRRGRRGRGGRGGFDPAQMISRLDQNQDGVITADEVENAPEFARRMLQNSGQDFSRGVRVDEIQQAAQQRMEEMRRQRDAERSEPSERPDRPDWSPPQSMGRGDSSGQATPPDSRGGSTSSTASTPNGPRPRARVSPLLPDSFQSYDMDQDGQIALSEWRKGKRGPISQFMQHDLDQDGFLTAKELMKANAVTGASVLSAPASVSVTASPAAATTNTANPTTSVPSSAPAAPLAPVTVSAADALKATGAFNLLDKDKSGTVAGEEWSVSRRLKPLFEKAGYDLAKPMSKDEFTQGYVRVGGAK